MNIPALIAAALLALTYAYTRLRYTRLQKWAHIPQLPPSLLWGHLKLIKAYINRQKPRAHSDTGIISMHKDAGQPPILFLDFRPVNKPTIVIADHDVADQIAKASAVFPWSAPRASGYKGKLSYLFGKTSIISADGEEWKRLRKRFNPGFAPQHLSTYIPAILDKGAIFLDCLDARADSQETSPLMILTTQLTFDVIGKVVLDTELEAQLEDRNRRCEIIHVYEDLLNEYSNEGATIPLWFKPFRMRRRAVLARRLHALLQDIVRQKHADLHGNEAVGGRTMRTVLSLSLQDAMALTPDILAETADQLQSFLFAGHDTTSSILSWAFYELSRTPHALGAVRAELNGLFGPDAATPAGIRNCLFEHKDLLHNMPYIDAVIKETLRLYPPAGTMRYIPPGSGFNLCLPNGDQFCADGLQTYICHSLVHRDRKVYGDSADEFLPERWLGENAEVPAGSWRPFERGPRNCIGLELAFMEARVIIAMAARRYDFVKVGLGEVVLDAETGRPSLDPAKHEKQYKVVEEVYPTQNVTKKPVDGMLVKVRMASA